MNDESDLITIDLKEVNSHGKGQPRGIRAIPVDCYYYNGQINFNFRKLIEGSVAVCAVNMSNGKVWYDSFGTDNEDFILTISKECGDYYLTVSMADATYEGCFSIL